VSNLRNRLPDAIYDAIVQLRADGLTYAAIASRLGSQVQTVRRAIKRYKATGDPRPKTGITLVQEAEIVALYHASTTKKHIAEIIGINHRTVASVLDRTGTCAIAPRSHKGQAQHKSNERHCRLCTILLTSFVTKEDPNATYCGCCKQEYPGWVNTGRTAKQVRKLMYCS